MAESSKGGGLGIVWPSVLAAVLTSSALVALRPTLESARPELTTPADLTELPTIGGTLATHARPWEDPLAAARAHHLKQKEPCFCVPDLQKELQAFVNARVGLTVIMPVWLRGGPYDDDKEQRLRTRFAVENALVAKGFVISYPERMTYTVLNVMVKIAPAPSSPSVSQSIIVPIKLYKHERDERGVVLIWLSESDLGNEPLHATKEIIQQLFGIPNEEKAKENRKEKIEIAVVGPTNSDVFLKLEEFEDCQELFPGIPAKVYSSRATSYDVGFKTTSGCQIIPIIGNDEGLIKKLRRELELRGAWKEKDDDNKKRDVILVTEHDTLYGREFPKKLANHFKITDGNLHVFRYLRGIDGLVPGQPHDQKSAKRDKDVDPRKAPTAGSEIPPTGQAQLDYLDRLVRQIKNLIDAEEKKGHRVAAIGVVGTDVYDKLLVLRALRKNFPQTLFFTTDLDSELCRASEYASTRNLIVVSHFGLELRSEFKAPAFRDSYQTATYLACRTALGSKNDRGDQKVRIEKAGEIVSGKRRDLVFSTADLTPLVFEIGRFGPYQLNEDVSSVHPPRLHPWWLNWWSLGILIATIFFLGICAVFSQSIREALLFPLAGAFFPFNEGYRRWKNKCLWKRADDFGWLKFIGVAAMIGSCLTLILVSINCHRDPDEEPFDIGQGISMWPSIYLRYLALVLAVILIFVVRKSCKSSCGGLYKRWDDSMHLWVSKHSNLDSNLNGWGFRFWVFGMTVFYIAAVGLFFGALGFPRRPSRGFNTAWADYLVLGFAFLFMTVLIFVILQTHHCFRNLIRQVGGAEWDTNTPVVGDLGYKPPIDKEVSRVVVVASGTRQLAYMGYFPFLVMGCLFIARLNYFDYWSISAPLVVVYLTNSFLLVYAAISIRKDANRLKEDVLDRLHQGLVLSLSHPQRSNEKGMYEEAIRRVENIREGAFRPWLQEPIFESLGGVGGLLILQQLFVPYL